MNPFPSISLPLMYLYICRSCHKLLQSCVYVVNDYAAIPDLEKVTHTGASQQVCVFAAQGEHSDLVMERV